MSGLAWLGCPSSPPDASSGRDCDPRWPASSSLRSAARGLRRAAAALLLVLPLLLGLAAGAQAQTDKKVWLSTDALSVKAYSVNAGWRSCGFWPPGPYAKPSVKEGGEVCGAVRLSSARGTDTTIRLTASGGTATSGTDYTAGPYSVTIPAGKTWAEFQIQTTQDDFLDVDETFDLEIDATSLPAGFTRSSDSGRNYKFEVIIEDDEYEMTFDKASYTVREDAGELVTTLGFSRPLPQDGYVKFVYTDVSATGGSDYTQVATFPNLVFVPAWTEKLTVRIPIHNDNVYEFGELFNIEARAPATPFGTPDPRTSVIIASVDPEVDFQTSAFTAHEGREAVVTFRVVEGGTNTLIALRKPATLHIARTGGTATAGTDYEAGPWTLTIPTGASKGVLRIPIHSDSASDDGETIDLEIRKAAAADGVQKEWRLADASGAVLSGHDHIRIREDQAGTNDWAEGTATVTIKDSAGGDPGTPVVWIEPGPDVREGNDAIFTLKADPAPPVDLDVIIHVDDATEAQHVADKDRGLKTATVSASNGTGTYKVSTMAADGTGAVRVVVLGPELLFSTLEPDYSAGKPSVALIGVDGPAPSSAPPIQVPDTAVSSLQVSAIDDASVRVTWGAVPHATFYQVEWDGEGQQFGSAGVMPGVTGTTATVPHDAREAMTLTIKVIPVYIDANGDTQVLNDLAGTATLAVGPGGAQTTVSNACVSGELQSDVEGYAQENYGDAHVARWQRVLKTFAGETGGMTGTEARQMEKTYSASRWRPVAKAIECLEAASQPTPDPEVTVSDGAGVTEGTPASFTVTASPAPSSPLTVALTVGQSGDFAAAGATGAREVIVPTGGSVTLEIATVGDEVDEPDGSVSVTVDAGDGYTVGSAHTHTVNVADDDDAPANAYATLIAKMYEWRNDPQWVRYRSHTDRWDRALLAFGESVADSSLTPMTAAEAQAFADRGMTRWVEVAAALHEIESGGTVTPDPVPVVTVSGGAGVTEGTPASFTITADPAPTAPLDVTLTVGQSGDYAAAGATGSREVTVPTGGSVTLDIATVDDAADEPDGSVSVTVDAGDGYTVGSASTHTVTVADDDAAPAGVPELSLTAGSAVEEGGNAEFTITANPAPQADLTVKIAVAQSGDYLSAPAPVSRTVTLTAGSASTTLTLATVEDGTDEPDGSVSVTIDAGMGYTVAAGRASGAVAVRDNDEPVVSIAAGAGVTEGDPASFTITADPAPAAPLTVTLTVGQSGDFAAAGQTGSREVIVPTGGSVTVEVATDDDSADEPDGSITATLAAGGGYTVAASPDDTATVAVADNDEAVGVPSLSVVDGEANESEGRLPVVIRLSPPSKGTVTVWAKTRESNPASAREGVDYRVWNARWGTRIIFRPGETERRLAVGLVNDSHDEGSETFEVALSDPGGGAVIADGTGVMTIVNSDPMPKAWLSRFGRTVAQQALDGIAGRMAAPRTAGAQGAIAGQALSFAPGSGSGTGAPGSAVNDNAAPGSLTDNALALSGFAHEGEDAAQARTITMREVLLGSSFTATGEKDAAGGSLAFWGRAAQSSFDGREGTFSLDGETTTAMLGADYARGKWLVGLALMQSEGEGGYADSGTGPVRCPQPLDAETWRVLCGGAVQEGDGEVEASLTAAVPYLALQASERLKLWGAFGHGSGEVTLKPAAGSSLGSDVSWTMAAAGVRGGLLNPPEGKGFGLALLADALWTRTDSEKTAELAASGSEVNRLRLGIEGSRTFTLEGGGRITPRIELGIRHDGGDAESGLGVEVGGGVSFTAERFGLALDISGRALLAHEAEDFRDRGMSVSLIFDPAPDTRRGASFALRRDLGGSAAGGLDALFASEPLAKRAGGRGSSWRAEAAWGLPAFGGRFTGSPYLAWGFSAGARDYDAGWRLEPEGPGTPDLSLALKATRREAADDTTNHGVGLDLTARW